MSPTAGRSSCLAARQCSSLRGGVELISATRRSPSSRSGRANGGTWSKGRPSPLRALWTLGLCARGEPDGRAVRSPAADGHRHGSPCGGGCPAIPNQWSRPIQHFGHRISGLRCGGFQAAQSRLVWVSRNGAEQPLAAPPHAYRFPHLSPDGRRVAVAIIEQESQIWLYDLSRETFTRFTFEGNQNYNPVWTPDGKRIAFESNKEGPLNIFWQLADGSGGLERLTTSQYTQCSGVLVSGRATPGLC